MKSLIFLCLLSLNVSAEPIDFTLEVTESKVLENLDREGIRSFASTIDLAEVEQKFKAQSSMTKLNLLRLSELAMPEIARLKGGQWFKKIQDSIIAEISEVVKNSGLRMTKHVGSLGPDDNREMPRYFDTDWLSSRHSALKLVAVVNRMDRMDFAPNSCGELRFIYRLAYYKRSGPHGQVIEQFSVLPFFLNVVYEYAGQDCQDVANLWKLSRRNFAAPESFSEALQKGPLSPRLSRLKQIELNMQTVRFSSGDRTDFGGQAIYLFRIFAVSPTGELQDKPLENTPDVTAILKDKELRADLLQQLTDPANFDKIDRGVFQLENSRGRLLAKKALSFSTVGRARLGNKPFSFLFLQDKKNFSASELKRFQALPFEKAMFVKSPLGLIERMNNTSCIGCHQSNGTAGFHMLGRHFELDTKTNRTAIPFSPHFYAERFRKAQYLNDLANGISPNRFRPHTMWGAANWQAVSGQGDIVPSFALAKAKELCLNAGPHFSSGIACDDPKLSCVINARNASVGVQFGECMYKKDQAALVPAGFSCREGVISNGLAILPSSKDLPFNFFSFNDQFNGLVDEGQRMPSQYYKLPQDALCGKPRGGIPMGRVRKACNPEDAFGMLAFADELLAKPFAATEEMELPKDICAVRGGSHIDECAATDHVAECLKKAVVPRSMLDLCSMGRFCREDYLCQQLPLEIANFYKNAGDRELVAKRIVELNRRNVGFCVPNYFVFNMRIDGHPLPK